MSDETQVHWGGDDDHVLKAVVQHWINKLEAAKKHKRRNFSDYADECRSFFNGPKNWDELMGGLRNGMGGGDDPGPAFKMTVNKAFEFVTLFGPSLYYQNPVRTVNPRVPVDVPPEFFADPYEFQAIQVQGQARLLTDNLRAALLGAYLNWTPTENKLDIESRKAIDEALLTGAGCLWTELLTPPGTDWRVVGSSFGSIEELLIDPDANGLDDAKWIARRCIHPTWQVERDFGLKTGSVKGNMESQAVQTEIGGSEDGRYDRARGLTNDLLTYWRVYSKMGIGGRLSGVPRKFRGPLEIFGDYVFLAIARDIPYPLNLPPALQEKASSDAMPPEEVFEAVEWPTPYWADGGWPVSMLGFHAVPDCPWPVAHLKAGMGELKFLNWAMSFIAGKVKNTCRDFVAVLREAAEDLKTKVLEGEDLTLLEIDPQHKTIQEVVQFLQTPPMNGDIWKVIAAVEENFDKRVGLSELMYGGGGETQIRSAEEANLRSTSANVRPDDMAKQVEAWMTEVARKEAIACRYHLIGTDIEPVMGQVASMAWETYVGTQDTNEATRGLEYRIEAGSTRKPNKDGQVARMNEAITAIAPIFEAYAQTTGDLQPINNLIADWAKSRDLDPARFQMRLAPPPPTMNETPQGPPTQPGAPGN